MKEHGDSVGAQGSVSPNVTKEMYEKFSQANHDLEEKLSGLPKVIAKLVDETISQKVVDEIKTIKSASVPLPHPGYMAGYPPYGYSPMDMVLIKELIIRDNQVPR